MSPHTFAHSLASSDPLISLAYAPLALPPTRSAYPHTTHPLRLPPPLSHPLRSPSPLSPRYFFEIFNRTSNATEGHAATGTTYDCAPGEVIFTEFALSADWVWTLRMGVKGDPTRLSTVVVEKPFMGLLPADQTTSWSEDVYSKAWSNTCWELYGVATAGDYPPTDMFYTINITTATPGSIPWGTWTTQQPSCPGHPDITIATVETPSSQVVQWNITRPKSGGDAVSSSFLSSSPSSSSSSCTTQDGVEYIGNNVATPTKVKNSGACCDLCTKRRQVGQQVGRKSSRCMFYTFDSSSGLCSLKNTNAPDTSRGNPSCE